MKTSLILLALLFPFLMTAQPGTLDKSFGDTGIVLNKNYTGGNFNKVALQSNGKIIAGGRGYLNNELEFRLMRYNQDGSIDKSFGDSGISGGSEIGQIFGMAITKEDDIVIFEGTTGSIKLAKYKKDGGIDSSFGSNGRSVMHVGKGDDATADMALQTDGKIVVCGYIINAPNEARQLFLVRYLQDGNLDNSFGENGIVILGEKDGDKSLYSVNALALQSNGQIIVAYANISSSFARAYRFNPDGSQDMNFGNAGIARFQSSDDIVNSYEVFSLAIQTDGKIISGGNAGARDYHHSTYMAAARLNTDGSVDSSFGNNGIQHVLFGDDDSQSTDILLQKDGKAIISGWSYTSNYADVNFALARLNPDGAFDESFGNNGKTITVVNGFAVAESAALQQDGKVVLGGYSTVGVIGATTYLLLARYNNDLSKKQIIFAKIRRWWQHHNGIMWDNVPGIKNYAIQRSGDGAHWSTVYSTSVNHSPLTSNNSQLTINNSPLSIHNYYNDASPLPGDNYYRLQTTSVAGAVNYSNVVAINNTAIKISPNPANNVLHIEGLPSTAKITVVDFMGNVKLKTTASNNGYNLNISSLKPGNYLLKLDMNGEVVVRKFLKE
ncbi:MAG: T9SS type A sorting domain-containing protein [Bacteroidetes bacterium]|nr:T9SS type A sorting domain-containing protein [Bacteroidota bacterium]